MTGTPLSELDLDTRLRPNYGLHEVCTGAFTLSEKCRTDDNPEIVVWGDSFAMHLVPGILASNPDAKIIQMTKGVCGPIIGLAYTNQERRTKWTRDCIDFNNKVAAWIKNSGSVRYAVLSARFIQYLESGINLVTVDAAIPTTPEIITKKLFETLDYLSQQGIRFVIFASPPSNGKNLANCLAKASFFGEITAKCDIEHGAHEEYRRKAIALLKKIAENHRVIRVSDILCNESTCAAEVEGTFIYRDQSHLSYEGSEYLGKRMNFYKLIMGR